MWSKRRVVDYALERRATLRALRSRVRSLDSEDAIEAHPLLLRSALHHGELTKRRCPLCTKRLTHLNYVYGDQLGQYSGRLKSTDELDEMQNEYGEFIVRVVEVCTECGWNYMIIAYTLGDGVARPRPRRTKTTEDIYG